MRFALKGYYAVLLVYVNVETCSSGKVDNLYFLLLANPEPHLCSYHNVEHIVAFCQADIKYLLGSVDCQNPVEKLSGFISLYVDLRDAIKGGCDLDGIMVLLVQKRAHDVSQVGHCVSVYNCALGVGSDKLENITFLHGFSRT